ncbi:MAG: beta-hydroxyacyl-ACP dehydratase [Candidatus Aminicenantes bacterium]|nr:beta-hydroxyacyl-ACP dehydratase [Candidatus Aminicenantes bacterium]
MEPFSDLLRTFRKKPLIPLDHIEAKSSFHKLDCGREDIKKIIPHREPFLLIDKLLGLDLTPGEEVILGVRFIPAEDPVFKGHFPEAPLYPGSLQLEMSGQLGLCLTYFVVNKRKTIAENAEPLAVRATKVLGALFLEPVLPDSEVLLLSKRLDYDGYFGRVISQVLREGKVCSVSIAEVLFL